MPTFGPNESQMRISILGCGWLGWPLARRLQEAGHFVRGSVSSEEKAVKLRASGLDIQVINLHNLEPDKIQAFIKGSELLVISVPPGYNARGGSMVEALRKFLDIVGQSSIQRIIYTSSIGIYDDTEDLSHVQERDVTEHPNARQALLLRLESLVLHQQFATPLILRLGGLIGEDRHPVYHLAGKDQITNPEAPVNLVHQKDCIDAIQHVIDRAALGQVYNLVFPEHPTRKNYYTKKARQLQLPDLHFSQAPSVGKRVSSEAFIRDMGFIVKAGV